jgi:hypothetical protein
MPTAVVGLDQRQATGSGLLVGPIKLARDAWSKTGGCSGWDGADGKNAYDKASPDDVTSTVALLMWRGRWLKLEALGGARLETSCPACQVSPKSVLEDVGHESSFRRRVRALLAWDLTVPGRQWSARAISDSDQSR